MLFKKCYFFPNNFNFFAVKKNYELKFKLILSSIKMEKLFQVKGECFRAYFANIVSDLIGVINWGSQDPV